MQSPASNFTPDDSSISLTLRDACRATGWSRNRLYDELTPRGPVLSYTMGSRRYVVTTSLRARVAELLAKSTPPTPLKLRRKDGPEREPSPRRQRKTAVSHRI